MTEPSLQHQARALGDPTRHAIFRYVVDAGAPVTVAELTEHFGFNHNAIRQHLARLVEARLLVEGSALPAGRGRPKLLYTPNPGADSRWGVTGPYERLAVLLAEVVRSGDTPEEVGRRAGRQSRPAGGGPVVDPIGELSDEMARQGFEPEVHRDGHRAIITLTSCPFLSVATADADTVCSLHLGLARGVADAVGGIEVAELEPRDPLRTHCRLHCHLTDPT
jgi:predicted ArsR family transcriptional regulator